MAALTAFVLGATGYIGGSVLAALAQRHPEIRYTALVRNPKDNKAVEDLGVSVIQGLHSDLWLIEKAASEHDIVFNFADCNDTALTGAIIKGLETRARRKQGTKKPILIHTSGTGVVSDAPIGTFIDSLIYDDLNVEHIQNIDEKKPHRPVDLKIFAAGDTGKIDTYIIPPSTIYGKGRGPVRNMSIQVNELIRIALKNRQVLQVGPGTNEWNNVNIDDLTDLYLLVLDEALAETPAPASAYERFYWGAADTHNWGDIGRDLAASLYKRGLVDTEEVKIVKLEEEPQLVYVATNSRTVANRGKKLGWKPSGKKLEDSLEEEIDLTLSQLSA